MWKRAPSTVFLHPEMLKMILGQVYKICCVRRANIAAWGHMLCFWKGFDFARCGFGFFLRLTTFNKRYCLGKCSIFHSLHLSRWVWGFVTWRLVKLPAVLCICVDYIFAFQPKLHLEGSLTLAKAVENTISIYGIALVSCLMGEQWVTFPSIKVLTATYISQRNTICSNDRRNSNTSGVCGDCQRSSAPLPWTLAILVLAVFSAMLVGDVAKSFWNCHSGVSSVEDWLFGSWMTASRNRSSRPGVQSCGSSQPQVTEPKTRTNVPAEKTPEVSAEVQPLVLLLKYMSFRHGHKSLLPFLYM